MPPIETKSFICKLETSEDAIPCIEQTWKGSRSFFLKFPLFSVHHKDLVSFIGIFVKTISQKKPGKLNEKRWYPI